MTFRFSIAPVLVLGACAFDWDGYDPRVTLPEGPCEPGAVRPCYSGPAGTEGVGVCRAGTQTCRNDQTFGACEGEVTPTPEQCLTTDDEDCDGVVLDPEDGCGCTPGEPAACYDGPAATDGIGACRAGSALCNAEGNGFASTCIGQVAPILEECGSPIDDDCNGQVNDWCATWSQRFLGPNHQFAWGAALAGNDLLVVGEVRGHVDFGSGALNASAPADAFAVKLDATTGNVFWGELYGGAGGQIAKGVAVDTMGDVYIAGFFEVSFDALVADGQDAFVVKVDGTTGDPIWLWHGGGTLNQRAEAIAVDDIGRAVVTGSFTGAMDLGAGPVTATGEDGFVLQLDAGGVLSWGKAFGGSGGDRGNDVELDASGNIYLGGTFSESIDFGGGEITDVGGVDAFVAGLDPNGAQRWIFPIGGDGDSDVWALALGPDASVHAIGEFDSSVDLGGAPVASNGNLDVFVVKLTSGGAYDWHALIGGAAEDQGKDIAVGPNGEVLAGLDVEATLAIGDELVIPAGEDDAVLVMLDAAGAIQLVRRFGEESDDDLRRVLVPDANAWIFTTECVDPLDFGAGVESGLDSYVDICIARLEP